jgi:hypothetical protein
LAKALSIFPLQQFIGQGPEYIPHSGISLAKARSTSPTPVFDWLRPGVYSPLWHFIGQGPEYISHSGISLAKARSLFPTPALHWPRPGVYSPLRHFIGQGPEYIPYSGISLAKTRSIFPTPAIDWRKDSTPRVVYVSPAQTRGNTKIIYLVNLYLNGFNRR